MVLGTKKSERFNILMCKFYICAVGDIIIEYSAILIISALYAASICTSHPLLLLLLE
jgi:hypothetical protein